MEPLREPRPIGLRGSQISNAAAVPVQLSRAYARVGSVSPQLQTRHRTLHTTATRKIRNKAARGLATRQPSCLRLPRQPPVPRRLRFLPRIRVVPPVLTTQTRSRPPSRERTWALPSVEKRAKPS